MTYKIYKIIPCVENADENDVYYGSTEQHYLCNRIANHRNDYKKWLKNEFHFVTSFSLFEKYGLHNCKIVLLEEFQFDAITEDELKHKEADYIENNKCVNMVNPRPLTAEDYKQKKQEYYKNVIMQDPDKKAKLREQSKAFLKQKQEEGPILCECGETYTYRHKARHLTSKKHLMGVNEEVRLQKEAELKAQKEQTAINRKAYKADWYQKNK